MSEETKKLIPIKWAEATNLIHTYHNSNCNKLTTKVKKDDGTVKEINLSGFSIDKESIKSLFEDENVETIFVAIGYHDGTIRPKTQPTGHSGIFFGLDKSGKLMISDTDLIEDYSKPCPPVCPRDPDGKQIEFDKIRPLQLPDIDDL